MAFPIDPLTTAGVFPQGQTSGWELTFSDEFAVAASGGDGSGLDRTKWTNFIWYDTTSGTHTSGVNYDVNAGGNSLLRIWAPSNLSGAGTNGYGQQPDRNIDTHGIFTQQYGYFETRAKMPIGTYMWPAFWIFNAVGSDRPEFDIFEIYPGGTDGGSWAIDPGTGIPIPVRTSATTYTDCGYTCGAVGGQIVYPTPNANNTTHYNEAFHIFGALWNAAGITYYVDGVSIGTRTVATAYPKYVMLTLAYGGASTQFGAVTATNPPRGQTNSFAVDYVRVWKAGTATSRPLAGNTGSGSVGSMSATGVNIGNMVWQAEAHSGSSNTTSLVVDVPAGTVNGELLLASMCCQGNVVVTDPAGWTRINAQIGAATSADNQQITYWRKAASEPANYTWTFLGSSAVGFIWRVSGANSDNPILASSVNSGVGATVTALGVTTTKANALVCYMAGCNSIVGNATFWNVPAGMTARSLLNTNGNSVLAGDTAIQPAIGATGNFVATADFGAADKWTAQVIAIAPALTIGGNAAIGAVGNLFEVNSHVLAGAAAATGAVGTLFVSAALAATVTAAPADGAAISGVVNFAISGTGIVNAELFPATGYAPSYGVFALSGGTSGTLAFDTTTLPNGSFACRISAFDKPAGVSPATEVVAMLARTYTINNVYSAALSADGSTGAVGTVYLPANIVQAVTASGATGDVGGIYEINSHVLTAAGSATGAVGDIYEVNSHVLAAAGPATGAVGSLTEINSEAVTASGAAGAVGSVIAIAGGITAITASAGTGAVGSVTEVNSHALTAAGAAGAVGTAVNIIGGIAAITASAATGAVGTAVATPAFDVTGNEAGSAVGDVGTILARALTASAATGSAGNAVMGAAVTGNPSTVAAGDVGIRVGQDITALTSKGFIGVPTYKTVYGATVAGVSSAGVMGAPSIIGKANITLVGVTSHAVIGDDDVNTWSAITAGSNGTWRPVIAR